MQERYCLFLPDFYYLKKSIWSPTTPLNTAIGPLGQGSGMRSWALRTCKADIAAGLAESEGERVRATQNINGGGGEANEGRRGA